MSTEPDDALEHRPRDRGGLPRARPRSYEVGAIGLAAAGFVSPDRTSVHFAPNIAWRDYPLRDRVAGAHRRRRADRRRERRERRRAGPSSGSASGRDVDDMLMLTVGTGLGGAVIVGGKLVRGAWGVAAEVGHMRVVPSGHYCGCGHEGCWEQYASGSALVRDAQAARRRARGPGARAARARAAATREKSTGPQVTQAAQDGRPAVDRAARRRSGGWIGEGSASVAALLDPELVVIGGGVGAAGDLLARPRRARRSADQLSARGPPPRGADRAGRARATRPASSAPRTSPGC